MVLATLVAALDIRYTLRRQATLGPLKIGGGEQADCYRRWRCFLVGGGGVE